MTSPEREALVLRNRAIAEAFHSTPFRHHVRRALLTMLARVPLLPIKRPERSRILLIRPDHLGDLLLSTPAIRALKQARPDTELHALVGPWSAPILADFPEVDVVLTLPFPAFLRSSDDDNSARAPYTLALNASRWLRRIGYDSAVILRPDHWWGALVAHLAGIRHIVGYDTPDTWPFLTERHPTTPETHAVRQSLRLVEHWTGSLSDSKISLRFPVNDAAREDLDSLLNDHRILPGSRLICIHPGAGSLVKRWETTKWAQVADILSAQLDARVIITGSQSELGMAQAVADAAESDVCVLAGETDIAQLAALFECAVVVLGPDSGPMHIAAAVDTPSVTLFGPARLSEFAPWGKPERHRVLTGDIGCLGCGILDWRGDPLENHPCVREISVARVLEAARIAAATNDSSATA